MSRVAKPTADRHRRHGKFITFEGIEGSGKSLQMKMLGDFLVSRNIPFVTTREPGGTPFGKEVRAVLLEEQGARRVPEAELLLYLADRVQDLRELIEPSLQKGVHVLCDRYHDATRAYQGAARGVPPSLILTLGKALHIRKPDLTLVFDLAVEKGLARAKQRNRQEKTTMGRFEAEHLAFHRRVRKAYRDQALLEPNRYHLIPAHDDPEKIHKRVLEAVSPLLGI
jgi:dTMP kinase